MSKRSLRRKKAEKLPPAVAPFEPFANPRARFWAYVAVFLISFALRVASSGPHFFASYDPGYRNFEFYDSNYQARRTEMIVRHYPHVPFHDKLLAPIKLVASWGGVYFNWSGAKTHAAGKRSG